MSRGSECRSYTLPVSDAGRGMALVHIDVPAHDVVYVKGIVEASEGLANVFSETGGVLTLASAPDRAAALAELARDLTEELRGS